MYSEQMMREQGFDDAANFRLNMYTDAIWRACRIILDVKMHRGEISVDDATRFMVEQTSFEVAERSRRGQPLHLHADVPALVPAGQGPAAAAARATSSGGSATAFSLSRFHDTLLVNGCLPISFHRRLLRAEGLPARPDGVSRAAPLRSLASPAIDLDRRTVADRVVAGRRGRCRGTDGPARRDRRTLRGAGRAAGPPCRLRRGANRGPGEPGRGRARRGAGRRSRSSSPAASRVPTRSGSRSQPARRASSSR